MKYIYASLIAILVLCMPASKYTTAPPSLPARNEEDKVALSEGVRIDTGAASLAGTLLIPRTIKPVAAVIIIPGSGASTRNGSWNMYRTIANDLVERGIAVLLYDKRGVGESTGNWQKETFDQRAQDVAAVLDYLRSRPDIPAQNIGLIGHSQGAYVAPLVVEKYSGDIKFVVLLAGPGQTVWDQILTNERAESAGNGLSEIDVNKRVSDLESLLRFLQKAQAPCRAVNAHYLCFVIDHDPTAALEHLTVPALLLYAGLDTQVPPAANIPLVESALKTAGNTDYKIHTFEGTNHWFAPADIGTTAEMRSKMHNALDSYDFVPGFLELIGDWITLHTDTTAKN